MGSINDQELVRPSPDHVTSMTANHSGRVISQSFPPPECKDPAKATLVLGSCWGFNGGPKHLCPKRQAEYKGLVTRIVGGLSTGDLFPITDLNPNSMNGFYSVVTLVQL